MASRESHLSPGHCELLENGAATQIITSLSPTLQLSLLSILADPCSPAQFGTVFSCSQSGTSVAETRRRSCQDTLAAPFSVNELEVHSLDAATQSGDGPGEQPARSCLGFSCYMLSSAIARSMVSSLTSHARQVHLLCPEGTGSSYEGVRAQSGQSNPSKKLPPTLGAPCANTSAPGPSHSSAEAGHGVGADKVHGPCTGCLGLRSATQNKINCKMGCRATDAECARRPPHAPRA